MHRLGYDSYVAQGGDWGNAVTEQIALLKPAGLVGIHTNMPGDSGGLSRDDVLDNVTHYWLTSSGISSARLYWESKLGFFDIKGVELPVGLTVFPNELYPAPESWAKQASASSSTTTRLTRAAIAPPGSSRRPSRRKCGRPSGRCGDSDGR